MEYIKERVPKLYSDGGARAVLSGAVRFFRYRYPKPEVLVRALVNEFRYDHASPDPFKMRWVDPAAINTYTREFGTYQHLGAVRDGSWDQRTEPVAEHPKHEAVERRFVHGESWEETGIYEHMLAEIEQQGELDGCRTTEDVKERYEEIDRLYESITDAGYLPHEVVTDGDDFESRVDYVIVNIGRNGELIFNGTGWHRLAIAKILELDAIPVLVGVRHAKWQSLRVSLATQTDTDQQTTIAMDTGQQRQTAMAIRHGNVKLEASHDTPEVLSHPDLREFQSHRSERCPEGNSS